MIDLTKMLDEVRTAIADETVRTRIQADSLTDLEQLVGRFFRACVRHVAEAREAATIAERERCARIAEVGAQWSPERRAIVAEIRGGK